MKKLFFSLLTLMFISTASAQRIYFIYMQSEQAQPFFVRMDERIMSSTASGYLIIPRLKDSTYNLNIGFPGNKWPEQRFSVTVNRKDYGYLLKYFEGKGWGLFDLQNLSVQMATSSNAATSGTSVDNKDVSKFTDILSKAADDPTLKEKTVPVNLEPNKAEVKAQPAVTKEETKLVVSPVQKEKLEEPKPVESKPAESKPAETKAVESTPIESKPAETKPVEPEYKSSVITRTAENSTTEGTAITFVDSYSNGDKDTIQILIPGVKRVVEPVKEEPKEEKRFLDIVADSTDVKQPEVKTEVKIVEQQSTPASVVSKIKNNCPSIASESDFFKLRKKMAGETSDYDMIDEARTVFKSKCFSVVQVKNLSALFLNDLGKYMFFDAFYMFVTDPENYPTLQAELKDEYYINRFKAMLRN